MGNSRWYNDDHEEQGKCKKDSHCECKQCKKRKCDDHCGREVVDFDFFNQGGSIPIVSAAVLPFPEEVIGEIDLNKACSGDLVWLSGSSEALVTAAALSTLTFRIRKVRRFQNDPLLGTSIYTRTLVLPVAAAITFFIPLDFVDVISGNEDGVIYVLTVSGAGVITAASVSNTTLTGTQYS